MQDGPSWIETWVIFIQSPKMRENKSITQMLGNRLGSPSNSSTSEQEEALQWLDWSNKKCSAIRDIAVSVRNQSSGRIMCPSSWAVISALSQPDRAHKGVPVLRLKLLLVWKVSKLV